MHRRRSYVATDSPGNSGQPNDNFIFVTDQLLTSASSFAPWLKTGMIAVDSSKPFIGGESTNDFCGWSNAPPSAAAVKSATTNGQMEGTIDLAEAFGYVPTRSTLRQPLTRPVMVAVLPPRGRSGTAMGISTRMNFSPYRSRRSQTRTRMEPTIVSIHSRVRSHTNRQNRWSHNGHVGICPG